MNEKLNICPVCEQNTNEQFLLVEDHFLTKEKFLICRCLSCGFKFINPRPANNEIGKYYQSEQYISHNSSRFNLLSFTYRIARYFTIRGKYRLIKTSSNGTKLLDIGCGTGEVIKYCKEHGFTVQGVEPTKSAREFAIEKNGLDVKASLEEVSLIPTRYNCITLWHVLEHIHDLNSTLTLVKSLLDPEGALIIAVPNSDSYDAKVYGEFWAAYDVPRHLYHFTKDTMKILAQKHGFTIQKMVPQKLDAYYVSLLSEKYKNGHANYFMAFINGFRSNREGKNNGSGHSSLIFLLTHKKV